MSTYSLYIVRCGDDSLYTGIATDVARRLDEHRHGDRGSRYLRGRAPLELVFAHAVGNRSRAAVLEHRVKKLRRRDKEALIEGVLTLDELP